MANQPRIDYDAANAACDAIVGLMDSATATLVAYDGSAPANCDTAKSGNEVFTCTFAVPAFGAASNGVASLASAMTKDSSATGGTPTYFRVYGLDGTDPDDCHLQGTVGQTSGYDLNMNTASVTAGAEVDITAFTVTVSRGA